MVETRHFKEFENVRILRIVAAQAFDCNELMLRREMCIPHGHRQRFVPQEFRDGANIHVGHHQATRKSVAEIVPGEICNTGFPRSPQEPVART